MNDSDERKPSDLPDSVDRLLGSSFSRRSLIKKAGAAGALAVTPSILAACGGGGDTSGDAIKIGFVSPTSGALADFGAADEFVLGRVRDAFDGGIDTQDGKRDVEIITKDSESSPDTAGAAAGDLILQDEIDMMLVYATPETTNPVSDQCENNGVPCISAVAPWQSWFFGRGAVEGDTFDWTYHFFWGLEDLIGVYTDIWGQLQSNKTVGALWPNDNDGNAFADPALGFPPALEAAGYDLIDPGRYEDLTNDYSAQISRFRSGNAEIVTGVPLPPDFNKFYTQAAQDGYRPPIVTIAKAVLFPSAVDALGPLGQGLTTEVWWSPNHPFSSPLTGDTSEELASGYTEETDKQWTQPLGFVQGLFDVASDVLGRAADPKDKKAIADAIRDTQTDTIVGPVSWKDGPTPNVAKTPLVGGQWNTGEEFQYDLQVVSNTLAKDIPKQTDPVLIEG